MRTEFRILVSLLAGGAAITYLVLPGLDVWRPDWLRPYSDLAWKIVAGLVGSYVLTASTPRVRAAIKDLRGNGFAAEGILDVVMRGDERFRRHFSDACNREADRGGEIRLMSIAAPKFLRIDEEVGRTIVAALQAGASSRVLLLCPDSDAAKERELLEYPHLPLGDIAASLKFLGGMSKLGRVAWRCVARPPIGFVALVGDLLFLEPGPRYDARGPLGGRTPVLVLQRTHQAYQTWKRHFEYAWQNDGCDHSGHRSLSRDDS